MLLIYEIEICEIKYTILQYRTYVKQIKLPIIKTKYEFL